MNETILTQKYREMYKAMITKDGDALNKLLDDSFALVHMTGMRQSKEVFLRSLQNGTLNYFSEELISSESRVSESTATFVGKSMVNAAVFGGGKHIWRLRLDMRFQKVNDEWLITEAVASTW